jgi:hypothetical protein
MGMGMQHNYFQLNGHYYRKTFSTSVGNALSPFLANVFMAEVEARLSKLKIFPKDLVIINRRHNTVKFTHEVEDNETLCRQKRKNSHSTSTANLQPLLETF